MVNVNDVVIVRNNFGSENKGIVKEINGRYATIEMRIHDRKDETDEPYICTQEFSLKSHKCRNYCSCSAQFSAYFVA